MCRVPGATFLFGVYGLGALESIASGHEKCGDQGQTHDSGARQGKTVQAVCAVQEGEKPCTDRNKQCSDGKYYTVSLFLIPED